MRILSEPLASLATMIVVALAVAQGQTSSILVVGITALVLVAAVRSAAVIIGSLEIAVGSRARAHREVMTCMPEPRHPATAGLPLARAPSPGFAA